MNSEVDPCLFLKESQGQKCVLTLYVDDSIMAGDERLINETISNLEKVFKIKVQGNLDDYFGCEVTRKNNGFFMGQKRIIEDLVAFADMNVPKLVYSPTDDLLRDTYIVLPLPTLDILSTFEN
jgi:Reverse transcriptase (RNA-dependent DNA polymerase)